MEYLLNNALLALLEYPGSTLLGVNRIFSDKNYRSLVVANVTDPSVKAFWTDEYAKYSDKFATEATAAIQNKVGQFAANPLIRNMVGQPRSTFDIRKVMDEKKIFIVNLSKGRIGEGNANLLGSMLITKIYLAAMSRAEAAANVLEKLPPFYLYVDEFQSFANESFADILSEARKYKLSLTIAHQYIEQMSDEVRAAVFGNVGTMITFRVGSYDAEVLEKEFAPTFTAEDLVNLGFAQIYLKLMINGIGSPPFSATTLDRPKLSSASFADRVVAASRAQFARPRAEVEEEIKKWHEPVPEPPRDPNAPPETKKYAPGMRPPLGPRPSYGPGGDAPRSYGQDGRPPRGEYSDRPREPRREDAYDPGRGGYGGGGRPPQSQRPERAPRPPEEAPPARPFAEAFSRVEVPATGVEILPEPTPPALPPEEDLSREDGVVHVPVVIDDDYIGPDRRHEERRHDNDPHAGESSRPSGQKPERGQQQPDRAPASLRTLNVKKDKGPSQEKLSDLRAALALALKQPPQTGNSAPLSGRDAKARPAPAETSRKESTEEGKPKEPASPKEVPESVLRGIIEGE